MEEVDLPEQRSVFFLSQSVHVFAHWSLSERGSLSTNLGSSEIRVSTYISAKLKKRTYMYDSLQFPVEMNTRGSKTDNFYSFSHEVWLTGSVLIIFSQLLAEWYVMTSKQF